jgi:hypothetical protein
MLRDGFERYASKRDAPTLVGPTECGIGRGRRRTLPAHRDATTVTTEADGRTGTADSRAIEYGITFDCLSGVDHQDTVRAEALAFMR